MLEHWEQTELEQLGTVSKVKKYSEKYYYPVEEIASKEPVEVFRARVLSYIVAKKKKKKGEGGENNYGKGKHPITFWLRGLKIMK